MVEIAKLVKDRYNCFFVGCSDECSSKIKNSIFEYIQLKPWLTKEKNRTPVASGQNGKFCRPLLKELEERLQSEIGVFNKSSKPKLNLTFQCFFQRLQAILLRSKFETASLGRIYQYKNFNKNPERVIQEKFRHLPNFSLY
jgi:hypothetical protein